MTKILPSLIKKGVMMRKGVSLALGISLTAGMFIAAPTHAQSNPCPTPVQAKKKIGLGGLLSAARIAGVAGLGGDASRAIGNVVDAAAAAGASSISVGGSNNCNGGQDGTAAKTVNGATPAKSGWSGSSSKGPILASGESFPYDYLVQFWRTHPPGTTLSDKPDDNAPGLVQLKPKTFVHDRSISKSEIALIERKLTIISDTLLALPPLKDIRGSSTSTAINIKRSPTGQAEATLSIGNYPITLSDPKTFNRNGFYYTPGEAPWLTITFNSPLDGLTDEPVALVGSYNGLPLQRVGRTFAGYIAKAPRPLTVTKTDAFSGKPYQVMNPDFLSKAARPSELQLLTMKVGLSSVQTGFSSGKHPPTTGSARLLAALFMADWNDIVRRMEEVR